MATTATILTDTRQADGTRNLYVRYDFDEGLPLIHHRRVAADWDAQKEANNNIPKVESDRKILERAVLLKKISGGESLETVDLIWHTRAEIRRAVFKEIYDSMRANNKTRVERTFLEKLGPILRSYTKEQIATSLGITVSQGETMKLKMSAMNDAGDVLDPGFGDI